MKLNSGADIFEIKVTTNFLSKLKKLAKKYTSIKDDIRNLGNILAQNPEMGIGMGKSCYKVRLAITSKNKGKSAGARLITYVITQNKLLYLVDIYDKSEQSTISTKELNELIANL